jgi:hypothetical protein
MSPPGKARQFRSASPEHDEDTDYKLALRLSEELNGDPSAPSYSGSAQQLNYSSVILKERTPENKIQLLQILGLAGDMIPHKQKCHRGV